MRDEKGDNLNDVTAAPGQENCASCRRAHSSLFILHSSFLRPAFSFTEILFAVIVLGIGFILIAGVFPVAIQQSQTTLEETTVAALARQATAALQQAATSSEDRSSQFTVNFKPQRLKQLFPPTVYADGASYATDNPAPNFFSFNDALSADNERKGLFFSFRVATPASVGAYNSNYPSVSDEWINSIEEDILWKTISGNLILPTDPRFAFVPFYRRGIDANNNPLPYVQVIVIGVMARNRDGFTSADVAGATAADPVNLQPRPVAVRINNKTAEPDTVEFLGGTVNAAAEGAFLVIADHTETTPASVPNYAYFNGRVFRLGSRVGTTNTWELMPGGDFNEKTIDNQDVTSFVAGAFLVGRRLASVTPTFEGPAQDVTLYTTFLRVN